MQTQFDQMLAAVRRAETVDDSVLIFIASVTEQMAGLRTQLANRGDSTTELDLAIANLNQKSDAVVQAIKANTSVEHEEPLPATQRAVVPAIVDPNTVAPPKPADKPVPVVPAIVDPNTVPVDPTLPTLADRTTAEQRNLSDIVARSTEPQGDALPAGAVAATNFPSGLLRGPFPTLVEYLAAGYPEDSYLSNRDQYLASQAHMPSPNAEQTPPQVAPPPPDGASPPVLDVAPEGHSSAVLNDSGAVPGPKSPDELTAEQAGHPAEPTADLVDNRDAVPVDQLAPQVSPTDSGTPLSRSRTVQT